VDVNDRTGVSPVTHIPSDAVNGVDGVDGEAKDNTVSDTRELGCGRLHWADRGPALPL
jgi:hypothetical protein